MTELIIWKNKEMDKMRRDVERLFDRMWMEFGSTLSSGLTTLGPSLDISETEETVVVRVELPGVDPNDVQISVTDRTLHLRGEKKVERVRSGVHFHRVERRFGSFSRTVELPCPVEVEEIEATYEKGVLMIVMPKRRDRNGSGVKVKVT
ncbi:MAG: Hsp20/alpha crystallin family protein [Deltaproteobacteria bacterium]|nr:Hsp20/alpha crystallin family protein [Deltaproteobacteria bacterium]